MTAAGPSDGGANPDDLKDKAKHPFGGLREKLRDTKLYDLKVGLIHKKCVNSINPLKTYLGTDLQ
jgi:phospholipase D1/2